jgi:hypothetical protein
MAKGVWVGRESELGGLGAALGAAIGGHAQIALIAAAVGRWREPRHQEGGELVVSGDVWGDTLRVYDVGTGALLREIHPSTSVTGLSCVTR